MDFFYSFFYNKVSKINIESILIIKPELTYSLTKNIRNLKQLNDDEKTYITYLDKDELLKIIDIYNDCIITVNQYFEEIDD
jgi:hypothetical protein